VDEETEAEGTLERTIEDCGGSWVLLAWPAGNERVASCLVYNWGLGSMPGAGETVGPARLRERDGKGNEPVGGWKMALLLVGFQTFGPL
jgi:hypothetical protein